MKARQLPIFYSLGPYLTQLFAVPLGVLLFKIFTRLELEGLENIKRAAELRSKTGNGVILAGNHTSELDGMLITSAVHPLSSLSPLFYTSAEQKHFLSSSKFGWRRWLYGSFFLRLCGAYPIAKGQKNYEKALKYHISLLRKGRTVCIFPEGTMIKDSKAPRSAHGGVTYLAYKTNAVIVPVHVFDTCDMTLKEFLTRKRNVRIVYGKPITSEQLFGDKEPVVEDGVNDFRDAAQKVVENIESLT